MQKKIFFGKCLFAYKIRFAVEKKIGIKIFCVAIKKTAVKQTPYMGIV